MKKAHLKSPADLLDEALQHCQNLAAIAELMMALAPQRSGHTIPPETIVNTGWLIAEQTERLQDLLRGAYEAVNAARPKNT